MAQTKQNPEDVQTAQNNAAGEQDVFHNNGAAGAYEAAQNAGHNQDGETAEASANNSNGAENGVADAFVKEAQQEPQQEPDFKEKYLRTVAEMENLRKRMGRDVEDTRQYAVTNFAREMLDVADNLERALGAIDKDKAAQDPQLQNLVEGVEMVHDQLQRTFGKFKIEKITPELGEKFNPERHQAMFELPTPDYQVGTVAQVMQPGYVIAGRLLRPAMVGTAKPPQENQENNNN